MIIWRLIFFCVLLLLGSCTSNSKKASTSTIAEVEVESIDTLVPLETGEVAYNGDVPFGEIIELKGRHITGDTAIFKLYEEEVLCKDNVIVLRPSIFDPILTFKLPEVKSQCWIGSIGKGPEQFLNPVLVHTTDTFALCYVTDHTDYRRFFKLTKDNKLHTLPSPLNGKRSYMLEYIYNTKKDECIHIEKCRDGMYIMKSWIESDSVKTKQVYKLNLKEELNLWSPYIGCFAVNVKANRMVYAYKYFRTLKFMDMEAQKIRTITFKNEQGFDDNSLNIADGLDRNVSHYCKIYPQLKHVYIYYFGETPIKAYEDVQKGIVYSYIEQYDWNGIPIRKYKLDTSGYFFVDEKHKKLYMLDGRFDEPFFEYDLP